MTVKVLAGKLGKTYQSDAGWDLYADGNYIVPARSSAVINTGVRLSIPEGVVGKIESRSGLSVKNKLEVGAGVIDSGYHGEIKVHLHNFSDTNYTIVDQNRIAQILFIELSKTDVIYAYEDEVSSERGDNGFGSTGKGSAYEVLKNTDI